MRGSDTRLRSCSAALVFACALARALALALALFFAGAGTASAADEQSTLIWLSFDGVRHDQPDRQTLPGLQRIEREGVRAEALRPVFPSTTFPNHVSQATCARPTRHGIVGNRFRDRARGDFAYEADASWILAEPLWIAAERQGVRAAAFFWVGSETPWRGLAASYRRTPFDSAVREAEKVDQILEWLDRPIATRPRLIMTWWRGSDRAGHRHGPDAPEVDAALREQDAKLIRLIEELDRRDAWSTTTLFVSSDHGMGHGERAIDVAEALEGAGVEAELMSSGAVTMVHLREAGETVIARAEAALSSLPGHRVHRSRDLVEAGTLGPAERLGELVLVAEPPHFYARTDWTERWLATLFSWWSGGRGIHGYDPKYVDMHGIFYAVGRGVPSGRPLGTVSPLDLAPTASRLLGIDPPADCEGSALPGFDESRHASPWAE